MVLCLRHGMKGGKKCTESDDGVIVECRIGRKVLSQCALDRRHYLGSFDVPQLRRRFSLIHIFEAFLEETIKEGKKLDVNFPSIK